MDAPISTTKNDDGTWTVNYFGKEIGWISRARLTRDNDLVYRALTRNGDLRHFRNIRLAKNYIVGSHH